MRKTLILIGLLSYLNLSYGQSSQMAKDLLYLINEARTKPDEFLVKYKNKIQNYNPKYAAVLSQKKPIKAVIWDPGLEAMCKAVVEENELNPIYKGSKKLCGNSSGQASGNISKDPLEYLCNIFTNVHDKDCQYLGLYFNKTGSGYSFHWGVSCDREKIEFTFKEKIDSSRVNFDRLNTARRVDYMTTLEKRMLLEINFVRTYPKIYAKIIAQYLASESASWVGLHKNTYEAGMELIKELNELEPLSILDPKECVFNAAKLHGLDCKQRGYFSHTGSNGSDPWDRIIGQCPDLKFGNENGAGNADIDPRIAVIGLLLDDGITSRGHRYNILDKAWRYAACYRYDDPIYGFYWVQNFAN